MTIALITLAIVGIAGSLFVIGSLIASGRADDATDRLIQQDWPYLPKVFPTHSDGDTR